jgi:Protein of unknown function (DUF2752)
MYRGKLIDAAFALAIAAIFIIALVFTIDVKGNLFLTGAQISWSCPFKLIFSYPCPFCGLSRSFVALAHGDISTSLHYHILGWLMALAYVTAFILFITAILRKSAPVVEKKSFIISCQVLAAVFVLSWLVRISFS